MTRLNEKTFCPQVGVGELVYLCQRPPGRNKIQDARSPTVYRVMEIVGTTYTVEPLEGGPSKRVHRSELHPGVVPTRPRSKEKSGSQSAESDGVVLNADATHERDQSQELETGEMHNTDRREVPVLAVHRSK